MLYVTKADVVDLFDLMDAYVNHTSTIPMYLPNIIMTDDVTLWLTDKKHVLHKGKILLYAHVPEPTEEGTDTP